ncbi:MAG: cytochrome c [Myxococcota bacterium]
MKRGIEMKLMVAVLAGMFAVLAAPGGEAGAAPDKKLERLWKAKCASCHGADGKGQTEQGRKKGAEDMTTKEWQKARTDADMKKAILEGFKREKNGIKQEMEPYKDKLKPEEVDALIQYSRAFGP